MTELLADQGYRLGSTDSGIQKEQLRDLFSLPLPKVHRQLGPMTLKDALETLAGPAWLLVEDPAKRIVSFERCSLEVR